MYRDVCICLCIRGFCFEIPVGSESQKHPLQNSCTGTCHYVVELACATTSRDVTSLAPATNYIFSEAFSTSQPAWHSQTHMLKLNPLSRCEPNQLQACGWYLPPCHATATAIADKLSSYNTALSLLVSSTLACNETEPAKPNTLPGPCEQEREWGKL